MSSATLIRLIATATLVTAISACGDGDGGSGGTGGTGAGGTGSGAGGTGTGAGGGAPDCETAALDGFAVQASLYADGESGFPGAGTSVTGTVTEVGGGSLTEPCFYAIEGANGVYAKLEDADGASWTACLAAPGAAMPLAVGDAITVNHQAIIGDIDPSSTALTIRKDGALVLFAVGSVHLFGIDVPPEIQVNEGELRCSSDYDDGCDIERYAGDAVAGDITVTIEPGDVADVGDFEVHFGALDKRGDNGNCDSGSASLDYFVVPRP